MSRLGESILYPLAAKAYRRKAANKKNDAKESSYQEYWQSQMDTSPKLLRRYTGLSVEGKDVIDIGCGLGGRTAYLAKQEPKSIIGTDINEEEIHEAMRLRDQLVPELSNILSYRAVTPGEKVFPDNSFDVVIAVDCLEHIMDLSSFLSESHRILRPGGVFFLGGIGWYHHKGPHMQSIIPLPFLSVFFSDTTILNVARKILGSDFYVPARWDSDPPTKRWEGITSIKNRPEEQLNEMSLRASKKILKSSPFSSGDLHISGFSENRKIMKPFNFLARIPPINEMWHSYAVIKAVK